MIPHEGTLFLTARYERTLRLPGLTLRGIRGPGPQPGDMRVLDLHRASDARASLENLKATRVRGVSRALPRPDLEERLERMLQLGGEQALNQLRDDARELAPALDALNALESLEQVLGALMHTRKSTLVARSAVARASGRPFDERRVRLFEVLAQELTQSWADTHRPIPPMLSHERAHLAFVEAYFSNFIEGTRFEVDEAEQIVLHDAPMTSRPADAHDILGTYRLLFDESEMRVSMGGFAYEDFSAALRRRHATLLAGRPEARPGDFKRQHNRAGNTHFVSPELVEGTLEQGLGVLTQLTTGFQRAALMMFLVAEVHPFDDGNGRLSRAMMNAELWSDGEARILVPTAYRTDYLGTLRRLSRDAAPRDFVRMLDRAHEFTARLDFEDMQELKQTLERCNAFDDTELRILRLPKERA